MRRSNDVNGSDNLSKPALFAGMGLAVLCLGALTSAQGQAPGVVFSRTGYVSSVNSVPGLTKNPDYAANTGRLAANSRGDVFFQSKNYSNVDYVIEIPANGGAQITLLTNISGYTNPGVYVDAGGNLWAPDQGGGTLIYDPFVNGAYAPGVNASTLPKCTPPIAQNLVPCDFYWNLSTIGNYVQPSDVSMDGNGNLYVVEKQDGVTNGGHNRVIKVSVGNGDVSVALDNLPESSDGQVAADAAGDLYYADGTGVYSFSAVSLPVSSGESFATIVGTGLSDPTGVTVDAGGNLLISDTGNARIVEIPNVNGQRDTKNQYTLITGPEIQSGSTTSYYGVAADGYGNIYFVGENWNSINRLTVGNLALGSTPLGAGTGALGASVYFTASSTFGSFSLVGGSGSAVPFALKSAATNPCTAGQTYAAEDYCNVSVVYTATAAGPQSGFIRVLDNSKNVLGEAALSGFGQGAGLNVDPATVAAIGSGWKSPDAIAVDPNGNTYVADSKTGNVYKTAPGGMPVAVASGFSEPSTVVVDGAGNLYVGDSGNGQIVEVPFANGSYGTPAPIITGLSGQSGLAIDPLGNLYVADGGDSQVLLLSSSGNLPIGSLVTTVGSGFIYPVAVAVDNSANLYVFDLGSEQVIQVVIPTSQQLTILAGLKAAAVAVDAGGSLYAADSGSGTIVRIPSIGGVLDKNFETTLATAVAKPVAIALDSAGNLYAADNKDATVAEMMRTAGALNFGSVNVNASSSAVSANLTNGGTAALDLSSPYYTASGDTGSFALQASSTCAAGVKLDPGAACSVAAIFTPKAAGLLTDTLTFSSNAANSASLSLVLSGKGTQLTKSTLTIEVTSPTGSIAYGQPVTVSATLTPEAGGVGTPTGTVTFYVDTVPQAPATLTADKASIVLKGLTGGKHVLSASYSGNADYASSASANLNIQIGTASTVTSAVIITSSQLWSNPVAVNPGVAVTLTVSISLPVTGTPTGTATFYSGSLNLGSGPVLASGASGGTASLSTSTLAPGNYSITATYNGDSNFTASTSPSAASLLVSPPTVTMTSNTLNISPSSSATLTLSSIAGFGSSSSTGSLTSDVSLACSGLPKYSVCSFQPAFAAPSPGAAAQVVFSILVNQPPPIPPTPAGLGPMPFGRGQSSLERWLAIGLLISGALFGLALRRARRTAWFEAWRRGWPLLVLVCAAVLGASGCGNGLASYTTPNGTSTVTVTATISPTKAAPNPPPAQTLEFTFTVN